ncbi:MAG TPA: DUF4139 domain-containing protein, partial [Candidatus Dormibacteraeota bacterium]|nr:DUF4139 domain-containing protein [Candidatus Dormibacteraeota bacterium]
LPLLAIATLLTPALTAAELTPESRVTEVTVYRQGALVTREARLSLPPGSHRVVLQDLPCVSDPDSVRAGGDGGEGIEIGGVEVRQEFRQPSLTPGYRQIRSDLEDLERRQALLSDRQKSIATLRQFLDGLKATAGQESSKEILARGFAVESWQRAFDFLSSRLDGLSEEERGIEAKSKDLNERTEVARGKLAQMNSQGGIQRWNTAVLLSAARGGEMTLRVSYLAGNATWQPLYDARLDPASERVSLSWQAQIVQTTGEDWKDVAVTLATTQPSAGIDLPVLASLELRPISQAAVAERESGRFTSEMIEQLPVIGRNYQDVLTLAPGVGDVAGEGSVPKSQPIQISRADASRREVAVTFDLPGRLDIPSDGQAHKHLIATREMTAKVEHRAVPRVAPGVYLVAKVTLPGEVPLLPGRVQHFVGGDLVGSSMMAERAGGEEFSLSFGPDDRLKAERKQVFRKVDHRGKDDEVGYRFVTTLENHLGRDGMIEVKDRIPVSGDERIVVSLDDDETTPGAATDPKEPGVLTWKIPVPQSGKKEIALTYRVRSPRSVTLAGLD